MLPTPASLFKGTGDWEEGEDKGDKGEGENKGDKEEDKLITVHC